MGRAVFHDTVRLAHTAVTASPLSNVNRVKLCSMNQPDTPRVEWAVFCEKAGHDTEGFLSIAKILRHASPPEAGAHCTLVFGTRGAPRVKTTLQVTLIYPTGVREELNRIDVQFGDHPSHFDVLIENAVHIQGRDMGALRAEFRFDGETEPNYVATLFLVPPAVKRAVLH